MAPELPAYYLTRPAWNFTPEQETALADWYARDIESAGGGLVTPPLGLPVWAVVAWLGEQRPVLLHGTADPSIREFEPRQPIDSNPFGAQLAVYASSDGVWSMFYSVLDRTADIGTMINGSFVLRDGEARSGPYTYFSVSEAGLAGQPWRSGWLYLLPRAGFVQEPLRDWQGLTAEVAHWASLEPVRPLARLAVQPGDFPFLTQVRGHDEEALHARMLADPDGFPWADAT